MKFIADLHIHSKFSMATASNLDLENLYIAAQYKGISLLATGDCTHPGWYAELESKLVPAEPGFYALHPDICSRLDPFIPGACRGKVRFILSSEISCIYKKDGKVRKNHNLVYFPDLKSVRYFNERLGRIGNIVSDGRPILGLDSRNLLEMVLNTHERAFLVPAHIWTPWFSLLGSRSGFNHIRECFDDLTDQIFAVETGLSSDPAMNWRVSFLDNLALISNSDAHSPGNLGREANIFNADFDYMGLYKALREKDPARFLGTYEFYPEEGKYHLDGHRKCGVRFTPKESVEHNGLCPVCGKPLTLGVLYRVCELADRSFVDEKNKIPFHSLVPLKDILSEILDTGSKTKKVQAAYEMILKSLGPEFSVLSEVDTEATRSLGIPLLGEALARVRENRISLEGGYDGDYGKVSIFSSEEKKELSPQTRLFVSDKKKLPGIKEKEIFNKNISFGLKPDKNPLISEKSIGLKENNFILNLNSEQSEAAFYHQGPSLIIAGPGTGKTRTITAKMAWLMQEKKVKGTILAITFTRKAAEEMQERLMRLCGPAAPFLVHTFHGLGYEILREAGLHPVLPDFFVQEMILKNAVRKSGLSFSLKAARENISRNKRILAKGGSVDGEDLLLLTSYEQELHHAGMVDFDDLVGKSISCFLENPAFHKNFKKKFGALCIDEYQDLDAAQYRLLRLVAEDMRLVTAIGDPNQAIYGFRGGDPAFFDVFMKDWPGARRFHLIRNYRSTENILDLAWGVLQGQKERIDGSFRVVSDISGKPIVLKECVSEKDEAAWIADCIQKSVGGTGHHAIYAGKDDHRGERWGFSDIGVLVRTRRQTEILQEIFAKKGIPFETASENFFEEKGMIRSLLAGFRLLAGSAKVTDLLCLPFGMNFSESLVKELWEKDPLVTPHLRTCDELRGLSDEIESLRERCSLPWDSSHLLEVLMEASNPALALKEDPTICLLLNQAKGKKPEEFLSDLVLKKEGDFLDLKAEKVRILTLHASKGLEFPLVFMAGCEAGFLPYTETDSSPEEEERRLFYVGVTRAGACLFMSWANRRMVFGKPENRRLSPFVMELETMLEKEERKQRQRKKKNGQMELF